jgi:hypothetical protein
LLLSSHSDPTCMEYRCHVGRWCVAISVTQAADECNRRDAVSSVFASFFCYGGPISAASTLTTTKK